MKKRALSILIALALCLSLLPGTARAAEAGGPGVIIGSVTLESGKQYVAGEYGVVEKTSDTPAGAPYLDYNDGVLTVHGQMDLKNRSFYIDGGVTFTGGEDSCLETGSTYLSSGILTLSGNVDFKPRELIGNYSGSPVTKLTTTDSYSGDVAIGFSTSVVLDVKNSASISITGNVNFSSNVPQDPMTLKSTGNINITSLLQYHTFTIAGKNVSLTGGPAFMGNSLTITAEQDVTIESSSPAIMGAAVISAGGNVTISGSIPAKAYNSAGGLTVKNAQTVSIQGNTDADNSSIAKLLAVPVTFDNCGNVTVTDTGTGEILKEGVAVTSNCPWTATAGGKTVTIPSGSWTYGGNISSTLNATTGTYVINSANPIVYDAGEGKIFYKPAAEGTPAVLTLDGASFAEALRIQPVSPVQMELKGNNQIKEITTGTQALTLTGTGSFNGILYTSAFTNRSTGTLNALVGVAIPGGNHYSNTVYGKCKTSDIGFYVTERSPCTIAEGAVLTVDTENGILFIGLASLTNNGTIINNSVITINDVSSSTADADISAFIKELKLTGTGSVTVKKVGADSTGTETYTNSGLKLLPPAGTGGALDLSSAGTDDTSNWDTQGYKWENVVKDTNSGAITSATLTLAEGFNATSVTLPDAAVTIVTTGESRIGTLSAGNDPNNAKLTFSGPGKLTITEHVEISGGAGNIITVNEGAKVVANNGISIGASGGIDSTVTVNGTLTVAQGTGTSAIYGGKVSVGDTGVLEVSGENGVQLNGMTNDFSNLFTVIGNGRFTADCSEYNIIVNVSGVNTLPKDENGNPDVKAVISLTDEYLPDDCEAKLSEDGKQIDLIRKSTGEVYKGPLTIHKNHVWSSDWTDGGEDTHYHACTYPGCTAKNDESPHYYAHGTNACRDCGHTRPAGAPDSDSGSSGDFIGSFGGFDGFSNRDSGYTVTVEESSHGKVSSDRVRAGSGSAVTLTVTPDSGYILDVLTVTDSQGNDVGLTQEDGGKYTFIMPDRDVTVRASFVRAVCTGDADCPSRAFPDLDTGSWYHEAVDYVLRSGLMDGYTGGLFGPNDPLSRVQFAQILYNRAGRPAVTGSRVFTDTAPGAWYADAVAWAVGQDIAGGYGDGRFGPDDPITREQLAAILWRYAGRPEPPDLLLTFSDADQISPWAAAPLRWAVERGIVSGKGSGILDPQGTATRAEAAQMLKNFLEQQH